MIKATLWLLCVGAGCLFAPAARADCVAGQQVACACPGGKSAVQVCADDGKRFGPCSCEAVAATTVTGAAPATGAAPLERKSPVMFATGIALLVFGGLSIPGGIAIIVAETNNSSSSVRAGWDAAGGTFIGIGVAAAITGTIFTILGGQRVAAKTTASWLPALLPSAPGALVGSSAQWTF